MTTGHKNEDKYSAIWEHLDLALRGLERLKEREGVSRDYLDLQMNLVKFRRQAISRIVNTRRIAKHLSEDLESDMLKTPGEEAPIVEAVTVALEELSSFLDQGQFPDNIRRTVEIIRETDPPMRGKIREWVSAVLTPSPQDISIIASELKVESEVLHFMGREVLKPFFHLLAVHHFTQEMGEKWNKGQCPMCNGFPQFARLEKEAGARWLWCDLCDVQWRFERLTCPFCGNKEVKKSRYFTVSENDAVRVTVCDNCQSYIKTYDERKAEIEPQLLVEDVRSLAMDMIASREGFIHPNLAMSFT
jgi:formate dehydrogenase accessory protein FdhE